MRMCDYHGQRCRVIVEQQGRALIELDSKRWWVLKGIEGVSLYDHQGRGRPSKHQTTADKQRAYRERKKGKALRKYERNKGDGN